MKQKSLFVHVGREGTPEVSKQRKIEAKNNLETIDALIYNWMFLIAEQGLLEDQKTCVEVVDYFPSRPSSLFRMLNACINDMI
jgi:hypothetical protein